MRIAGILTALAACGACGQVDDAPNPEAPFVAAEVAPPPTADEAIAIAMRFYADRTGVAMPEPRVRWWSGELIQWGDAKIAGMTFSCDDVWVFIPNEQRRLSETPFAHELAHCAKAIAEGDGDGSHSSSMWWDLAPGDEGYVTQAVRAMQAAGL